MNRQPAGQPAGQRPAAGQGPCISYMRGPCHSPPAGALQSPPMSPPAPPPGCNCGSPLRARRRTRGAVLSTSAITQDLGNQLRQRGRPDARFRDGGTLHHRPSDRNDVGPGENAAWLDQVGAGPQLKELDEINPESPRADVPPIAYMAPVAGMPAERGAAAADREDRAC